MSTPLATPSELGVYLGATITANDPRATLLIQLAHDRLEMYVSPVPAAAKGIELAVAARAWENAGSAHQVSLGSGSVSFGSASSSIGIGGLFVSRAEQRELRKMSGRTGAFSIDLLPELDVPAYAPVIDSATPPGATTGNLVTFAGYGFTGTISVTIGGTSAEFLAESDVSLLVVVPGGVAGLVDVIVTNAVGPSLPFPYQRA